MKKNQNFLVGALILGVAGAFSKVLGAIYRIPLARPHWRRGDGPLPDGIPHLYHYSLSGYRRGAGSHFRTGSAQGNSGVRGDSRRIFKVSLLTLLVLGPFFHCWSIKELSFCLSGAA